MPPCVQRFAAAGTTDAAGQPVAAFSLVTESQVLDLDEQGGGEAVVKLQ